MTKEIQLTNDEKSRGLFRGISLFGLRPVIFTAARFTMVLLIALSLSCSSKRIAKANVDQVTEGMSKKQVESILGSPTSLKTEDFVITKKTTYVYRQGKDTVTIVFKDDKVQSKDSTCPINLL